ncbi:MAG TPA: hypothetical protein VFV38_29285 [Ktedonobacteraceae bacterium]|nr:hypothetical protein [Ktedonobacteraceae bacterium]
MNSEMKVIREVNIRAEEFYDDAVKLGNHAARALTARHRSQMTSLENIAESSFKTSDIFDYIKKQTARYPHWRQADPKHKNPNQGFGERLKEYLEKDLFKTLTRMCDRDHLNVGEDTDKEKIERRRIYLLLMRQFIRQMIVQYEYQTSQGNQK